MSAVPYPCIEMGKVCWTRISNCLCSGEVLTLVPQAISQACVLVKGELSFPSLSQDAQGYQTCPSWQWGCQKRHTSLGYSFILVLRVCILHPVLW